MNYTASSVSASGRVGLLRWSVTLAVLLAVVGAGILSARRVGGAVLRSRADALFDAGRLLESLETYERAARWDPWAADVWTDPADTAAYALDFRLEPLRQRPEAAPDIAAAGVRLFTGSIVSSPPGPWSWAGIARVYEAMLALRPFLQELDVSQLGAAPLDSLVPEARLAEAALLEALRWEPANYFYLDSLGELYWRRGFPERALEPFRRAVAIHPVLTEHYYIQERVRGSELLAEAVQEGLEKAAQEALPQERWVVLREMGHLARLRGRPEEAAARFASALDCDDDARPQHRAALHVYLAQAFRDLGRLEEAVEQQRRAVALLPERPVLHATLGQMLGRLGAHAEAMQALGRARALDVSDPRIALLIARQCRRAGDLDGAERAYQDMIRLQPGRIDPYLQVIELFRSAGEHARAIPYARELVRRHPGEEIYRVQLEQLYEQEVRR